MLSRIERADVMKEHAEILIVEDSLTQAKRLERLLVQNGYVVYVARNGAEGLEAAARKKPTVVISDVMMPEMDGLTATRLIRRRPEWKKLPNIMLTAKAMKDDQARCLEAGANDYIAKPIDVDKLLSLCRVWLPH